MNFKEIFVKNVTYDDVKSDIYGICLSTPSTQKFWHTYMITYGDFMVILIVESCKWD